MAGLHYCRSEIVATLGQASTLRLSLKGDGYARHVRLYSSHPRELRFEASGEVAVAAAGVSEFVADFLPSAVGVHSISVNAVDGDGGGLVAAWRVCAATSPPLVQKTYDVVLGVGHDLAKVCVFECFLVGLCGCVPARWGPGGTPSPMHVRTRVCPPAENCVHEPVGPAAHVPDSVQPPAPRRGRGFAHGDRGESGAGARSRVARVWSQFAHVWRCRQAFGQGFIRLLFKAVGSERVEHVFVFINNADDQNEECLLIRARYYQYA